MIVGEGFMARSRQCIHGTGDDRQEIDITQPTAIAVGLQLILTHNLHRILTRSSINNWGIIGGLSYV
jgi:hypothetical protein